MNVVFFGDGPLVFERLAHFTTSKLDSELSKGAGPDHLGEFMSAAI